MQKCFKCSHALRLKWNLGRVMGKTEPREKVRKLNRRKIHVSRFLSVNRNRISTLTIMKHFKMAAILLISIIQKNFKLPTPSLGVPFSEC